MFKVILNDLKVVHVGISDLEEILSIALESKITYYDATYIYASKKHNLKLVSLDNDLLKFENTISLDTFLKEIRKNTP